jgi:1,6-anhydro-N-acetylmuramate kinase
MPSELDALTRRAGLGQWSKETTQRVNVEPVHRRQDWNTGGEGAVAVYRCEASAENEEEEYQLRITQRRRLVIERCCQTKKTPQGLDTVP